jgi:hypothetical protein
LEGKIKIIKEQAAYYGNSLGGIMGEVYMASTTAIRKGELQCTKTLLCLLDKNLIVLLFVIRGNRSWWRTIWNSPPTKC